MYRINPQIPTSIKCNEGYISEPLERKLERFVNNNEPIDDQQTPLIYQEREEGVQAAFDIRTDKWEIAADAMEKVYQTKGLQREMRHGEKTYDTMTPEEQEAFNKKHPKNKYAIAAAQAAKAAQGKTEG